MLQRLNDALDAVKKSGVLELKGNASFFADAAVEAIQHLHAALDTAQQLAVDSVNEVTAMAARLEQLERLHGLHVENYDITEAEVADAAQ